MHEMTLETTYSSGAEEWACPICGRRFIVMWEPSYQRIVLEPGDENAPHGGGNGGAKIGAVAVRQEPDSEEQNLSAFEDWFENVNLGDL